MALLGAFFCLLLLFASSVSAHGDLSIHVSERGFEPSELIIEKGETVTFENVSTKTDYWPASDIHPTHNIYPEFDPKRPVKAGETWEFTFNKVGTWKFHDHLFPQFTGQIKVLGEETDNEVVKKVETPFFQRIIDDARVFVFKIYYKLLPQKLDEISIAKAVDTTPRITFFVKILGAKGALSKLLAESNGGSDFDCHRQAHILGRISYEVFGSKVFAEGDSTCHSGFYHGAMETFLHEEGTDNLAEKIHKVCKEFSTSFGNFECLHGVGHGVMAYEDYDLPAAISVCKQLDTDYEITSCDGGVFMENVVASQGNASVVGHETKWVSGDPHYPCNQFNDDFSAQSECYKMQTSRMLDLMNHDFAKVAPECMKAPKNMIALCYLSLGRDAAGFALRDPDKIIDYCRNAPDDYRNSCYTGALNVIVEFWGERLSTEGETFCNKLLGSYKSTCLQHLSFRKSDVFNKITPQP